MKTIESLAVAAVILGGSGAAFAASPAAGPSDPFSRYREFLIARHPVGKANDTYLAGLESSLTDEGRAQLQSWPADARKAVGRFFYFAPGLVDVKLAGQTIEGDRARVEAILLYAQSGAAAEHEIGGAVEMVRTARGWVVLSETLTPPKGVPFYLDALREAGWSCSGGRCAGLGGGGVFPTSLGGQAAAKSTATARDLEGGDAHAVAQLRAVLSAQAAYQMSNGGSYDRLECLATPWDCIPGYSRKGPAFIDAALASSAVRNGYRSRLDPGQRSAKTPANSPTSLDAFAVWLIPEAARKGGRTLCGDYRGVVCATADGSAPVTPGECPADCQPLR